MKKSEVKTTKSKSIKILDSCRICNSKKLYEFLDMGFMPIPNGFIKPENINQKEAKYNLSCVFCEECGLVQLSSVVDPYLMFKNYVYVPSASKMMMENFVELSKEAMSLRNLNRNSLVVDIGSNDGSLLSLFKNSDSKVLGIDPAENLAKIAEMRGVPTESKLFNCKNASKFTKKYGQADIITATNVVAHVNDLGDFFKGISRLLTDKGVFITEFPHLLELIRNTEFDTIYHEHLSYFSLKPWIKLTEQNGFNIIKAQKLSIHGGSIRLFHTKKTDRKQYLHPAVLRIIKKEEEFGLYNKNTFVKFEKSVKKLKKELVGILLKLRDKNKKIVGYGAAAKGNVLTNYFNIGRDFLEYIVDSTPYKHGLLTPGKHIPVFTESKLSLEKPDYVLILAWNFAKEIIEKEKSFKRSGGKFIIPNPRVKIV